MESIRHLRIRNHLLALQKAGYIGIFSKDSENGKAKWFIDKVGTFSTKEVEAFISGAIVVIWETN